MKNWLQRRFINFLAKNLYNTISKGDVLKVENGKVALGKKQLNREQVMQLKEGAGHLLENNVLKILFQEVRWETNKKMYYKSKSIDDIIFSKAVLYTLDLLESKLKELKKL